MQDCKIARNGVKDMMDNCLKKDENNDEIMAEKFA
jgi:hypothetical protein